MEIVFIWLAFGIISAIAASSKGRSGCAWFFIGMLFGPFGLIAALIISKEEKVVEKQIIIEKRIVAVEKEPVEMENKPVAKESLKKCPRCTGMVRVESTRCPYCRQILLKDKN